MSDPYSENTVLLLHFEGSEGDTTTTDSSDIHRSVNMGYNGHITTAKARYGTSCFTGGAGGGFTRVTPYPLPPEYQVADGQDFTIEASFFMAAPSGIESACLFSLSAAPHVPINFFVEIGTGHLCAQFIDASGIFITALSLAGSTSIADGSWHDCALVRSGTTYYLFQDGVLVDSATDATTLKSGYTQCCIGMSLVAEGNSNIMRDGWLDEVRFTRAARYIANYTPGPFADPDVLACDPDLATRSAILHFDGIDGATTFVDSSSSALALTGHNSSALTSTTPKFGATSLASANSHYVSAPIVTDGPLDLSNGDFTIEGWFWQDIVANELIFGIGTYPANGFYLQTVASGQILGLTAQPPTNATANSGLGVYTAGVWNSFAVQRRGNKISVACNGVFGPEQTFAGDLTLAGELRLGGYAGSFLNGKLDDVRVTKGAALHLPIYAAYPHAFPDTACGLPTGTVIVSGRFVPSSDSKAIEMDRLGTIKPRIYAPVPNRIVRTRP